MFFDNFFSKKRGKKIWRLKIETIPLHPLREKSSAERNDGRNGRSGWLKRITV
jgi:hypothetical protein